MNLSFEAFSKQHIAQAVQLALDELAQERTHCPALPQNDFTDRLTGLLSWLAEQRYGQAAVCEGRLMGYLVFAGPWDGVLGHAKGVFSPLGGSAIARACQDRAYLASMLLESVANRLVAEGVYSIEIARFAHDETVARSLVLNGFGIRCCDAVQRVDCLSGEGAPSGVVLTELPREAFAAVRPLQQGCTGIWRRRRSFFRLRREASTSGSTGGFTARGCASLSPWQGRSRSASCRWTTMGRMY